PVPDRQTRSAPRAKSHAKTTKPKRRPSPVAHDDDSNLAAALRQAGAKSQTTPRRPRPQLATLATAPPEGKAWIHEIKLDGYRMLCRVENGKATFISRNQLDWSAKFPELVEAAAAIPVASAILDGEVASFQKDGTTSFQALQNAFRGKRTSGLVYVAFDILHLNGFDLAPLALERRKAVLEMLLAAIRSPKLRFSEELQGNAAAAIKSACKLGLEGIVSKRRDQPYVPGRGLGWIKTKCSQRDEFVIGGYTPPSGSRRHFGALLLGYFDSKGKLRYAGRVGSGFSEDTLGMMIGALKNLKRARSPFDEPASDGGSTRDVTWVEPKLVAEIAFAAWTDEGRLRQATFEGLREDKLPQEVLLDRPISPAEAVHGKVSPRRGRTKATPDRSTKETGAEPTVAGVILTHPEKVLYPDVGVTKVELARYYEAVGEWMLPHAADRALALVRCPAGSEKPCFFQKHPGESPSERIKRVDVSENGSPDRHLAIADVGGLVELAQMGVLEVHAWGSKLARLETPDRLTFDLDPGPGVAWAMVVQAARRVRDFLGELGLESFLKTTGGKGLHVVAPIQARTGWD
ncbi:MAG TPA: DNA ligase D, partial [Planctomycetia bacterium]|nr:DNA ligase D [Planctomycetia bacterium]